MSLTPNQSSENLAAPPTYIHLGSLDLLCSPASHRDLMTIRKHLRSQMKSSFATLLNELEGVDEKTKTEVIRLALAQRGESGSNPDPGLVEDLLLEPSNTAFLVWVLARKEHPSLKLEEVKKEVNDDNVIEVLGSLSNLLPNLSSDGKGIAGVGGNGIG